ncbi:putative RNA-directed DNA polymerase, eukaryota, reverse transcriptase zinc-binding domain protein [Tanacetum coccineum]|uniref:RNA-directed DNA polymerase, eukaryota, reverse transcriptase zinc-binding domain protein n=1 Tax=Tanacetum coccineum TaxID=301880 RepID=A0ABQ4XNV7_9ASTR
MINGEWILNPANVKEAFLQYYKDKFQAYVPQVNYTSHSSFASLSMAERIDLEKSVSSVEIRKAVWDCGSDKSPGPDGFTFLFLKRYWDIFKSDVEFFVSEFFSSSKMPPGTNSSFITLIPKVCNPSSVKDYRPISLIGLHYKIIAKNLANRLASVIGNLKYLDYILLQCGFGEKWRSWISECLKSARTSILINGSPTSEFSLIRGLRQGDPLSPFLFILIMEGLHIALKDALYINLIRGVQVGNPSIRVSHFFYVDDVVLVTEWNQVQMDNILCDLNVFFLASTH